MKIPNYSSRNMAIHDAKDLAEALKTPGTESTFQVGNSQLKSVMELAKIFDAETQIPNRDALPIPPAPLMKKVTKLPRVKDQMAPTPGVDQD